MEEDENKWNIYNLLTDASALQSEEKLLKIVSPLGATRCSVSVFFPTNSYRLFFRGNTLSCKEIRHYHWFWGYCTYKSIIGWWISSVRYLMSKANYQKWWSFCEEVSTGVSVLYISRALIYIEPCIYQEQGSTLDHRESSLSKLSEYFLTCKLESFLKRD